MELLVKEISQLNERVQALSRENAVLRNICTSNGILHVDEKLAVIRHRRHFTQLCAEHSTEGSVTASDAIYEPSILHRVADFSRHIVNLALTSRSIFAECKRLTQRFPWTFGFVSATLEEHEGHVYCLAALEGG